MNTEKMKAMNEILKAEVKPALGCTGPIGISYVAAEAAEAVGGTPKRIKMYIDKDMCAKNGDVGIPGTDFKGLEIAAAMGAFGGDASAKMEVLKTITPESEAAARAFAKAGGVEIVPDWDCPVIGIYISAEVETENGVGKATVIKTHTNLVYKEANGKVLVNKDFDRVKSLDESHDPIAAYGLADFYEFATEAPIEELMWLQEAYDMNLALSTEAMEGRTGMGIAKTLYENAGDDIIRRAKAWAAAGSEARMGGLDLPTMACATTGNGGISCSMPLWSFAKDLGRSQEDAIRALALSYFVMVFGKNQIGRHSAMCACVVAASCGVASGATLLLGGSLEQVSGAIMNTICNVFGVVCDGARYACAMKLSSAAGIAIEGAYLSMKGVHMPAQGVTDEDGQKTIEFMGKFARTGMTYTDMILCQSLYEKLPKAEDLA